jgi:hypothetical protein
MPHYAFGYRSFGHPWVLFYSNEMTVGPDIARRYRAALDAPEAQDA